MRIDGFISFGLQAKLSPPGPESPSMGLRPVTNLICATASACAPRTARHATGLPVGSDRTFVPILGGDALSDSGGTGALGSNSRFISGCCSASRSPLLSRRTRACAPWSMRIAEASGICESSPPLLFVCAELGFDLFDRWKVGYKRCRHFA